MPDKNIPILNKSGENIGTVTFHKDAMMIDRYKKCAVSMKAALVPLINMDITNDGSAKSKSGKRILHHAEQKVYTMFDTVLGYDGAYKAFFTARKPFAKVSNGQFYCLQCLQALQEIITMEDNKNG